MTKLIAALVLGIVMAFPASSQVNEIVVGKQHHGLIEALVCDTVDQVLDVITVHNNDGYEAAIMAVRKYNQTKNDLGEVQCGTLRFYPLVTDIVGNFMLPFPHLGGDQHVAVVEVTGGERKLYAILVTFVAHNGEPA